MNISHITAFGIDLRFMEKDDLPTFSYWRNHPAILPFMGNRKKVTPEFMAVWLNMEQKTKKSFPYIARLKGTPVAYTELKNLDQKNKICEAGLFLFGEKYIGTGIGYNIILCREIIMQQLGMETLVSLIRKGNKRSIDFCKKYGAIYDHDEGDFHIYTYELHRRRSMLKKIACILGYESEFEYYFKG